MKTTVINPWFRKDRPCSCPAYELDGAPIFEHRGVTVYRRSQSWLYVLGDTAITERAGFNKNVASEIIDSILDGVEPVSDLVALHLGANGYKALTWAEYSIEHAAGRVA